MLIKMGYHQQTCPMENHIYQGDIVQVWAKKLKDCSN